VVHSGNLVDNSIICVASTSKFGVISLWRTIQQHRRYGLRTSAISHGKTMCGISRVCVDYRRGFLRQLPPAPSIHTQQTIGFLYLLLLASSIVSTSNGIATSGHYTTNFWITALGGQIHLAPQTLRLARVALLQRLSAAEALQSCPQNAWVPTEGSRACHSHRWPLDQTQVHPAGFEEQIYRERESKWDVHGLCIETLY